MSTPRVYSSLETLISASTPFTVLSSNQDGERFITKLRHQGESEADGLTTEGSQITLYVSTTTQQNVDAVVDMTPEKWEFTLSEFAHPDTGEIINLKWLRIKR